MLSQLIATRLTLVTLRAQRSNKGVRWRKLSSWHSLGHPSHGGHWVACLRAASASAARGTLQILAWLYCGAAARPHVAGVRGDRADAPALRRRGAAADRRLLLLWLDQIIGLGGNQIYPMI